MYFRLSALVLVASLLALSACDVFGSEPGSFSATVVGDASASFSGEPVTTINSAGPSEQTYQFRLAERGNGRVVTVTAVSDGASALAEGEYPVGRFGLDLGPGQAVATAFLDEGDFLSRSGSLTLVEVTDDRVRGAFEFEGVGEGDDVTTVRGTFEADLGNNAIVD